ncbi:CHAP domain-containing protein [Parapedobacter sp. ISTM3]|uniref:CHAP domain-containing protein n=1 Tax=Parapedobacter sp. ISTM3 TaxID=2800130 RepID=UPI001902FE12|nr:CHAP domain-containing protein [Parapedobacter sp. ISTM3]MBK1440956.1 CHAP domain-containing protein [Parapedobacter sp. ISTM3]
MATPAFAAGLVLLVVLGLCAGTYRTALDAHPTTPAVGASLEEAVTNDRQRIRSIYLAELGVKEATGWNDGTSVEEYLRYCDLGPGYAWCAAYVSWCFGKAGYPQPRNPWSPALFPASRTVWKKGGYAGAIKQGDVFGIHYPTLNRIAHVGFVDRIDGEWLVTVEGNADNRVLRKRRHIGSLHAVADWLSESGTH